MSNDVKGIVRVVSGFKKEPDENGAKLIVVQSRLKPLRLGFLQKLFNINPYDPDPVMSDMVYCYPINEEQARALQQYVIDGIIDLNQYDFILDCYGETEDD